MNGMNYYIMIYAKWYDKIQMEDIEINLEPRNLVDLVLSAKAPRTQVETLLLTVDGQSSGMYVRSPAPVSSAFGVADVMTKKRRFTAHIAFQL